MAQPLTVEFAATPSAGAARPNVLTPVERDLIVTGLLHRWWTAHLCEEEPGGWADGIVNSIAAPVTGGYNQPPVWGPAAGPDGEPAYTTYTADATRLVALPGSVPVGSYYSGDWTIACVARAGTTAAATVWSIAGAAGGAVGLRLRSADLAQVVRYDGAGAATVLAQGPAQSAAWHLVTVGYTEATGALVLHVDGVQVATATVDLSYGVSRLSLFGAHDGSVDLSPSYLRGGAIASVMVCRGAGPDLRALIEAAVAFRYPSLA